MLNWTVWNRNVLSCQLCVKKKQYSYYSCGRSCWWCSQSMTKRSSPAGSGRGGGSERKVQSRSTPSEAKPWSLWSCGPAPSPAATPRVCHRPPDCTRGSPHSSPLPGTLWCWLSSRLRRCEEVWCGLPFHHHQRVVRCVELCPQVLWPSGFAFWWCWQWSCCHNLDR